jgi:peptidoglycan lytic transglycosylase G
MRLRIKLLAVAGAVLLAGTLAVVVLDIEEFLRSPLRLPAEGQRYVIPAGMTLNALASDLAERGVLARPRYLIWMARWEGAANRIQAGEYDFAAGSTPRQLLDQIIAGRVVQHALTLLEGWTFRQVMQAIGADPNLTRTLDGLADTAIMARLGRPDQHPEGRFFPDTYYFTRGTTDTSLLQRAYRAMQENLQAQWQDRAPGLPYRTPYEALILASIIEKEAGRSEERPVVAGVFVRRLQAGILLETDPTVIYGLGAGFDGKLRRRDLETDTPYNTYVRRGLPPTPIAMPGAESIWAALHPAPGKALYFVARGDGSHEFSETLRDHHRAVVKYQCNRAPDC